MFRLVLTFVAALIVSFLTSTIGLAQVALGPVKVGSTIHYHTTVGTTTALAIPLVSVAPGILGFEICADYGNTNSLIIGKNADAAVDGSVIGPGVCFQFQNASGSVLKALNVKGGAAAQGYSVVQFK